MSLLRGLLCRSCGWGLAGADGHCVNCAPPDYDEDDGDDRLECTHCGGDGDCMDGSDPLGNCPDSAYMFLMFNTTERSRP